MSEEEKEIDELAEILFIMEYPNDTELSKEARKLLYFQYKRHAKQILEAGYRKRPSSGMELEKLDENKIRKIWVKHLTNPNRVDVDVIIKEICDTLGRPKGMSLEEIEDIIKPLLSKNTRRRLAQALKNALESK